MRISDWSSDVFSSDLPWATDRLQQEALKRKMSVVDAPVGRLAEHADRGESLFMVGASDADFKRVSPLFDAMGTTTYHCGDVGTGGRTKLVNNYAIGRVSCRERVCHDG